MLREQDQPYDNGVKRLLTRCAQDFLDWLMQGAVYTGRRSERFQSISIEADHFHEVRLLDESELVHLEFQSTPDDEMVKRLLQYNLLAYCRYGYTVNSYVIYLRKGGEDLHPPLIVRSASGKEIWRFHYEVIIMRDMTAQEVLDCPFRGIWTLAPFTKDGARREVVEKVIMRFTPATDTDTKELLALTCLFASLMFSDVQDKQWVIERSAMLDDFLQESPLYQHILQQGLVQGIAQGEAQGLAQGEAKGAERERKQRVLSLRQKILELVQRRFPQQKKLAGKLINVIEKPEKLEDVLLQLAFIQTAEEMHSCLLDAIQQDE